MNDTENDSETDCEVMDELEAYDRLTKTIKARDERAREETGLDYWGEIN